MIAEFSRKDNHFIRIELEGYQPYDIVLSRRMSGWVFGNIVFGGVIGVAIDAVSGGIYRLTPEQISAELHEPCLVHSKRTAESYVAVVLEVDPSWEKIGQLQRHN